jgi:hypothetical protein
MPLRRSALEQWACGVAAGGPLLCLRADRFIRRVIVAHGRRKEAWSA